MIGTYTHDDWCVVLERWVEEPSYDYLNILMAWIQIYKIPMNYYTKDTIMEIAEEAGQVIELLFNPDKPHVNEFVRVRVLHDVANPLRNSKTVQFPNGKIVKILIEYEKVKKKCFQCKRLTHEKSRCLIIEKARSQLRQGSTQNSVGNEQPLTPVLVPGELLYGILTEGHSGFDVSTGRYRVSKLVLDVTRQYLMVQDPTERKAREMRVQVLIYIKIRK